MVFRRFCDSPTSDLDARTPKGRGKRGRGAASAPQTHDLSNFTETRSSVHSKLRNGAKGRRGAAGSPAPPSVPAFPRPEAAAPAAAPPGAAAKRKGRPAESSDEASKRSRSGSRGPTASPPASPVLLECPEPNCSKKYKHINGLKYHQSHAHGAVADDDADSKDVSETDESPAETPLALPPSPPAPKKEASPEPLAKPLSPVPPVAVAPPVEEPKLVAVVVATPPRPTTPPKPTPPPEEPKLADKYKVKIPSPPLKMAPQVVSKPPEAAKAPAAAPVTPKKKQLRKSPAGSPVPEPLNGFGVTSVAPSPPVLLQQPTSEPREEVQSPAYSDISDDGAPVDTEDKVVGPLAKQGDKKADGQPALAAYGMYPYYGQTQYLPVDKPKEDKEVKLDKEKKDEFGPQPPQQPPPQQKPHFYPYAYYPYNLDAASFPVSMDKYQEQDKELLKVKEEKLDKEQLKTKSIKLEPKEKRDENHQILKESIEMKSQMGDKKFYDYPYQVYHQRQQDELRRYYLHPDKQRKDSSQPLDATVQKDSSGLKKSKKSSGGGEEKVADKKEEKKQEGVKPTMETQGPPPPTNSYGYFNSANYMQAAAHYSALPFDPNHPVYRGMSPMLVPGPYGATPYLHAPMRYPGPEDLSRGPPPVAAPTKALDMLQHHASQYAYSSHKIHELQERALKSPQPPAPPPKGAPSPAGGPQPPPPGPPRPSSGGPPNSAVGPAPSKTGPPLPGCPPGGPPGSAGVDKETGAPAPMRSPPPQRHVHTHHHTHVGLGYPILPGQYPTPYGGKPLVRP